jgi:hypothetical protein
MKLVVVLLVIAVSTPAGAQKRGSADNPYDPKVWIAKLGDPREAERAVTELEQLGHPTAIVPLGEAWLAQGRPVRMLQVMISLARPLTPAEARAAFVTDFEKTGRAASWDKALPYLTRAVDEIDEANPRSVDSATKAAEALGEAMLGLDALVKLAMRANTKKNIAAQVSAIRAIGRFAKSADAVSALAKIVARPAPTHPRTAKDKQAARELEETFALYLSTTGAAINALAEHRAPGAVRELVPAMYRVPELFTQLRRALVASGPAAKAEVQKVLRGQHADVNKLKLDKYCGDRGELKKCERVSAKEFYAAIVLGDFYDPATSADLLALVGKPAAPAYFIDGQAGPTQHAAAFDALRKIGAPDAATKVRQLWLDKKTDLQTRVLAIGAYPFVARDRAGAAELAKIAGDNTADDSLRQEAATALARLGDDPKDIAVFTALAKRYIDAADEKAKDPSKQGQNAAKAYRGYARMFQTHVARIEIAIRCKHDATCFAASLQLTPDAAADANKSHISDLATWSAAEKRELVSAAIDRAMLELGKQGAKASQHTDALLDATKSDVRLVRQSILLALPKIAKVPCAACVTKLDAAIKAGEGKTTLGELNLETTMLRNYFAWAGK